MVADKKKLEINDKYLKKLDRITVRVYKDGSSGFTVSDLRRAAEKAQQSVQQYVLQAIQERMDQEQISPDE